MILGFLEGCVKGTSKAFSRRTLRTTAEFAEKASSPSGSLSAKCEHLLD
jgi:hypothetical protein